VAAGEAPRKIGMSSDDANHDESSITAENMTPPQKMAGALTIRKCESLEDMQSAFALQKEVWGFSDPDLVPVRIFVVASKIGGQVIGAFDEQELMGFALAIPGLRNGHVYLHSQMLAVRQQYRNAGLGRKLKLFQREEALARGIDLMEWTFDPLEIKNAYLNIEKLGAIARRYSVNQYGITSSPLQGGLPTDRLIAEWWMKSKRVEAALGNGERSAFEPRTRIDVPREVYQWKNDVANPLAIAVQEKNRQQFIPAFAHGLSVLGYERSERGDGRFLLGTWDEPWLY
jgi:predicted GNAT superfamily acetyltransferase